MNLIGNSCVSAFISKLCLKETYNNPFCWCKMEFESIYNLIKNYETINFKNVEFIKTENFYTAIIDNQIKVQYIHYIEDDTLSELTFEKTNVKGPNILEYVKEKYFTRLTKMKDEPIFILAAGYWQEYYLDDTQIQQIIDLNSKYNIIISMPNSPKNKLKSNNKVKILNHNFKMGIDGVHKLLAIYISNYFFNTKVSTSDQILNLS